MAREPTKVLNYSFSHDISAKWTIISSKPMYNIKILLLFYTTSQPSVQCRNGAPNAMAPNLFKNVQRAIAPNLFKNAQRDHC
jgi:hypothetical protein